LVVKVNFKILPFFSRCNSYEKSEDRNYLRAVFRIRLHIDDIATLYKIKEFLGVGNVTIQGSSCLYTIGDLYI